MDREDLRTSVEDGHIKWQRHALERMMERAVSREMVKKVLIDGEIIEDYPDDSPYPSALFSVRVNNEALHVVAAFDPENAQCFVITVYKPDLEHFESDYKTRRQHGS